MILSKLTEILKNIKPNTDVSKVNRDTKLIHDLGIDSLSMLLMSLAIEEQFDFKFETMMPFETVGQVCDYIAEKTSVTA